MKKRFTYCNVFLIAVIALVCGLAIKDNSIVKALDTKSMVAGVSLLTAQNANHQEAKTDDFLSVDMVVTPASVQKTPVEIYESMSIGEREAALNAGTLHMEYSALYTYSGERLSTSKGAQYFNGHKETYYSERVLPGTTLNIPGRHVAEDGTVRDGDGFICVAADPGFMPKGSTLITSLGPAKVYDSGCAYGIIDLYVNW